MLEALEKFQQLAIHFQPQLLGIPGLLLVSAGLCIWLAGLRWRKLIAAVAAALFVGCIVKNFAEYSFVVIAVISAITAIIAAAIEKIAMSVLAILIAVFIVLFFFAWPSVVYDETIADTSSDPNSVVIWPEYDLAEEVIPAPKAVEITVSYFSFFTDRLKNSFANLSSFHFAFASFAAILVVVITLIIPNTMMALTCALIGTILIAEGMFLLLLYKGSEPVTIVSRNPVIYATVLVAMIAFGTVIQILLQAPLRKATKIQKKDDDNGEKK